MALMEQVVLGRTSAKVSRMGLGCGGHSRLGLSQGKSEAEAEAVVREALALGVNFIDTAESYRTEEIVGRAIKGTSRDQVFISTKCGVDHEDRFCTPDEMRVRVEGCLKRLDTDTIDLFNLHGVSTEEYQHGRNVLVPLLQDLQSQGKIRFIGITEQFIVDTGHRMLQIALQDDCWDVMMVGFNLLNPSARETVLPHTMAKNIGTQDMFAVRKALSRPETLVALMNTLVLEGSVDPAHFDARDPLGFLVTPGVAQSLQEAAYRFCIHEPGIDVVLSGTGSVEHLRANAKALEGPPLPDEVLARLRSIFGNVDSVSGN